MFSDLKPSLRESSSFLMILLRLADAAVVGLLFYPIVFFHEVKWADHYEKLIYVVFLLTLFFFHSSDLYRPWRGQKLLTEFNVILKAWAGVVGAVLFLLFAFKVAHHHSRAVLITWFLVSPLAVFLVHSLSRISLRLLRSRGFNQRTTVIVGAGELGLSLARYIEKNSWIGIQISGFFDDRKISKDLKFYGNGKNAKPLLLGTIADLHPYLEKHNVDFVYITLPMRDEKKIHDILNSCRILGARIFLVPDLYAFRFFNTRLQSLGDILMLDFNPDSNAKRMFDIIFSLLVLLGTLPVTLLIALLIKYQDGGPVFYGHRRITTTGKEFLCLKFRTMHVNAHKKLKEILKNDPEVRQEWEKTFKIKNDPRVTWIGRFLRKTSLDELPQFINVLKGEMSVVGARPIVQEELTCYYRENGGIYCSIKPGITGPWQVSKRSDTEDYEERVVLDTWYALNRTFLLDLNIIFKTVGCMFKGKGAY